MSLFSNRCQGRLCQPLPCPRPRGHPFTTGEWRVDPQAWAPELQGRGGEGVLGPGLQGERVRVPPTRDVFHFLEGFANE